MTKYPLIEAMGLEVHSGHITKVEVRDSALVGVRDEIKYVLASDLERMLAEAPVVYGVPNAFFSHVQGEIGGNGQADTHTARLVCIQPIRQDTAEQFMRDWLAYEQAQIDKDGPYVSSNIPKFMDRARKFLEGK